MSEPAWGRAKQIFGEALELPRDRRDSFIEAACAGDPELRALVTGLLAADESAGEFMRAPSVAGADVEESGPLHAGAAAAVGDRIGPYTLVQAIGEGGFGAVFAAEQSEPLRRRVALKVIKLGMDTRQVVAQFDQERQSLALMDHPNIAKVFDAGATPQGRPYFVMEFIEGVPITRYCDQVRLTPRQRLELFIPVCQAVQHAHSKGIIHRDLKPSNVLVSMHDGVATPKIIDFGIAKATARQRSEETVFTVQGQLIGTPEYMSPEQAAAELDIDTRSDVYSLGVLLYELLTGTTPVDARALRSAAWAEMLRIIREIDPPKPSTRMSTVDNLAGIAECRRSEPRRLGAVFRGDLDWIVMKCLAKDRSRRYETANGLTADIQRHLKGEPVVAAPPSAWYRATKLLRRHRIAVAASASLLTVLLLGTAGTTAGLLRADRARKSESQVAQFMADLLRGVAPSVSLGRDTAMLKALLDDAAAKLDAGGLRGTPEAEVRLRRTIGRTYTDIAEFKGAERMLTGALSLSRRTWQGDHENVAGAMNDLGVLHASAGRIAVARDLFADALAMQRRLARGDDPLVAECLNNLAYCLQMMRRAADALPLYQESLEMRQRLFPGDHADVAESLNNVGFCFSDGLADPAQGLPMYQAALDMRERLFTGDHIDIAVSASNVGAALLLLRRPAEALPKFRASADMLRRLIPADHYFTAQAIGNVAFCLQRLGETTEALPLYIESLEMFRRVFPADAEAVAGALNNLGYCFAQMEQLEQSLVAY